MSNFNQGLKGCFHTLRSAIKADAGLSNDNFHTPGQSTGRLCFSQSESLLHDNGPIKWGDNGPISCSPSPWPVTVLGLRTGNGAVIKGWHNALIGNMIHPCQHSKHLLSPTIWHTMSELQATNHYCCECNFSKCHKILSDLLYLFFSDWQK